MVTVMMVPTGFNDFSHGKIQAFHRDHLCVCLEMPRQLMLPSGEER